MNFEKKTQVLPLQDLMELLSDLQVAFYSYKSGEVIFKEGTPPEGVYFVTNGQVKAYKSEGKNLEQQISTYTNATCFGYLPVLQTTTHPFTAVACGNVDVLRMDKKVFLNLLSKSPALSTHVFKNLTSEFTVYLNRLKLTRAGITN
jgi:CRP-like cAMP-binding protein